MGVAEAFGDLDVRKSMEIDFALIEQYDASFRDLELHLERRAKQHDPQAYHRLRSVPGIGKGRALSILAAKLGRAVYLLLAKERVFDMDRFLARAN